MILPPSGVIFETCYYRDLNIDPVICYFTGWSLCIPSYRFEWFAVNLRKVSQAAHTETALTDITGCNVQFLV